MLARSRFALWTVFVVSLVTAFWQYFEFAYTLAENGLIESPIWSGALGTPWVHHGYIGFGAGASIVAMQGLRWRSDRRKKDQTHRPS
jgi:hypothetical protein